MKPPTPRQPDNVHLINMVAHWLYVIAAVLLAVLVLLILILPVKKIEPTLKSELYPYEWEQSHSCTHTWVSDGKALKASVQFDYYEEYIVINGRDYDGIWTITPSGVSEFISPQYTFLISPYSVSILDSHNILDIFY